MGQINKIIRLVACFPIKLYQLLIRPFLGPRCRFYPSCSQYAVEAIQLRGVLIGLFLTCRRLCRCHPGNEGGYDPVHLTKEN